MEHEIEKCKEFEQFTFRHLTTFDVSALQTMILEEPPRTWEFFNPPQADNISTQNRNTANLPLIHTFNDWDVNTPLKRFVIKPLYDKYMPLIEPFMELLNKQFPNCIVSRMAFSKLFPKKYISPHVDFMDMIKYPHRVHLPITTNNCCLFIIGDDISVLKEGALTHICQHVLHSVVNDGDTERIHLIIDFMNVKYVPSYEDIVIKDEFDEEGGRELKEGLIRYCEKTKVKYPWFILDT